MRLLAWTACLLATLLGTSGIPAAAAQHPAGVEVDLVFPRNETYAPTGLFPFVFAVRNVELAKYLNLRIYLSLWDGGPGGFGGPNDRNDEVPLNWTQVQEPFFLLRPYEHLTNESNWSMGWSVFYDNCTRDYQSQSPHISSNWVYRSVDFSIRSSGQVVDLVAATQEGASCSKSSGVALNYTGETFPAGYGAEYVGGTGQWQGPEACAVLDETNPIVAPDPCSVRIDAPAAASMMAVMKEQQCELPPFKCPRSNTRIGAGSRVVAGVGGWVWLAVAGLLLSFK